MGFLSGLLGGKKQTVPATGFYSQPGSYQSLYNSVLGNTNTNLGQTGPSAFTPLPQTSDETRAFENIRQGYTPTSDSISRDVGMLMNPYNEFVMDPVNRAAQSDYSILKQNATQTGQFGSNRQQLGANDIEQTRLSTIGNLNRQNYNDALSSVLNNIIPQRQRDDAGLLGIGEFQRNLNLQTQQAPYQSMLAQQGLLGSVPTEFGNFGSQQTTIKQGGGLDKILALAETGAKIYAASDRRVKENIEPVGEENGFPVYKFNYIGDDVTYIGVMADDVEKLQPEAVSEENGVKKVDYNAIGVVMREA